MKKGIIGLIVIMGLLLTACGNTNQPGEDDNPKDEKLSAVFLGFRFGDKGWNDSLKAGVEEAGKQYGEKIDIRAVDIGDDIKKYKSALIEASEGKDDLIIVSGFEFKEIMEEVAPQYPEKKYIIADVEMDFESHELDNVLSTGYKANESSFLAGMVAAYMTTSNNEKITTENTIGFIGGVDNMPVIWDFLLGYIEGAQYVDPAIKVAVSYVGDFQDAAKAKELALAMINNQAVDIIFSAAGSSGIGSIEAASEMGIYAIGADLDQSKAFQDSPKIYQQIVTSALKRADLSLTNSIKKFVDGDLEFGVHKIFGVEGGYSDLVYNDVFEKYVDSSFVEEIKAASAKISSGEIELKSAYEMDAKDIKAYIDTVKP